METITSKDNEKIKELKKLGQKKYREKLGKFVVENWKIVTDAGVKPESLFVTDEFLDAHRDEIEGLGVETFVIDEKVNKAFSNLDTPSGIAAIYAFPPPSQGGDRGGSGKVVYLNAISDPGNLGTILRSALAFNLTDIVVDEACADVHNPKTIQAAKDAIFKLNIGFDEHGQVLRDLKAKMPIVSTRLEDADPIESLKQYDKFCLVLGSEAHGIDPKIQKMSDAFVKIEMSDKIESLNVAASAAIIFHEIFRVK